MRKKVLVVDDDEGILEGFEAMLDSEGYVVEKSQDGSSLLMLKDLPEEKLPHLIILDVLLSGKDGREICKGLKEDTKTKNIPIIMVSAHPKAGASVKECGADDYLKKPFEMNVILNKVAQHLR